MRTKIDLAWSIGAHKTKNETPNCFIPAEVPGAAQLDFAKANGYEDYHYGENYKQFLWMEDSFFTYQTSFHVVNTNGVYFVSRGIDYRFDIIINKTVILEHEGMFSPIKCDLSPYLSEGRNTLSVVIYPSPKSNTDKMDRSQANASVKPAVSYGWDFHPRLIPCGIWDETYIEQRNNGYIEDVACNIFLSEDLSNAELNCTVRAENAEGETIRISLCDPAENTVLTAAVPVTNGSAIWSDFLQKPQLWWPNEHGEQNLYTLKTELICDDNITDSHTCKKGFRRIELVLPNEAIDYKERYPKTRNPAPIAIKINNKVIFAKGSNWVCPTVFPGTLKREDYDRQLTLMRDAHMNIVRCWGGSVVNKEDFYDLCDEYGLIVWQDFPLSCNNYKSTPHYLSILKQEATAIVSRLKEHTSLGIWCGGNELFCFWSGMDDQSIALRTLNKICLELDPYTPFLATAPLYGMGHGGYVFRMQRDNYEDIIQIMNHSSRTAYSEFGCPSVANINTLKSIIPLNEWDSFPSSTSWKLHHADDAWSHFEAWFEVETIKHYFGEKQTLEELVENSRLLQGIGYKYSFEEARRQAPKCSMALNWCFNEPWKTAAGNHIVEFDGTVKPAYYEIKKALRTNLLSLRAKRFDYTDSDIFEGEVWLLCEEEMPLDLTITVTLISGDNETKLMQTKFTCDTLSSNKQLFSFKIMEPIPKGLFSIALTSNKSEINSEYLFVKR